MAIGAFERPASTIQRFTCRDVSSRRSMRRRKSRHWDEGGTIHDVTILTSHAAEGPM